MIDLTKHLFTPQIRKKFLGDHDSTAIEYDGFCSHVFETGEMEAREILKISHSSRLSLAELGTELMFTRHLAEAGVPICAPLSTERTIVRVPDASGGEFFGYRYKKISGHDFGEVEKNEQNLRAAGRVLANLHKSSIFFPGASVVRADFLNRDFVNYKKYVPTSEIGVHAKFDHLTGVLKDLPREKSNYGLCHGDAHDGNFLISEDNSVHLIDFDDVEFGFYASDFSVLIDSCIGGQGRETAEHAEFVFSSVYGGYKEVRDFSAEELSWIPLFVRYRWLMQHTLTALLLRGREQLTEKQLFWREKRIALIESDFSFYDFFLKLDFPSLARKA